MLGHLFFMSVLFMMYSICSEVREFGEGHVNCCFCITLHLKLKLRGLFT